MTYFDFDTYKNNFIYEAQHPVAQRILINCLQCLAECKGIEYDPNKLLFEYSSDVWEYIIKKRTREYVDQFTHLDKHQADILYETTYTLFKPTRDDVEAYCIWSNEEYFLPFYQHIAAAIFPNEEIVRCMSKRGTIIIANKSRDILFDLSGYYLWKHFGGIIDVSHDPFVCNEWRDESWFIFLKYLARCNKDLCIEDDFSMYADY